MQNRDHAVIGAFAESAMPSHAEGRLRLKDARPNTPGPNIQQQPACPFFIVTVVGSKGQYRKLTSSPLLYPSIRRHQFRRSDEYCLIIRTKMQGQMQDLH